MPRILSWNVSLSLRTKWAAISEHRPDLAVLPEVARADLESLVPDANHRLWIGDNDRKGLGLVSFGHYALELDSSFDPKYQFFLPARVAGPTRLHLLAVWSLNHRNRSELAGQRDATLQAVNHYRRFLSGSERVLVAGDFNHNVIWDRPRATRANFRPVIDALDSLGLASSYHHLRAEPHGRESIHTLNWRNNPATTYHVDYCFVSKHWLTSGAELRVFAPGHSTPLSDHLALLLDLP